ncbi:MAG: succinylglutamate desuccinylase/aspartoacylase family protein [Deltaproteobacteria bacterium]|nr:succinylglutamate desuccinylase/aspartoacylase family protein [Deltaproteobacteria bacterium]
MKTETPKKKRLYIKIGNEKFYGGESKKSMLEIASLYDFTKLYIPIEVIRGTKSGSTLFISAAIHGDELNGVEIIKRVLQKLKSRTIRGTLIVVPVVNIFGFNTRSRYLPDRRDLNRCFPGNAKGSLGARLAHIFMKEIVSKCSHGIDLHTGSIHLNNLPQIRACLDHPETDELARFFGVPVVIDSKLRDGSLREAGRKRKVTTLLYEGGEALRFDENVIRVGVRGCLSVMRQIGMLPKSENKPVPNTKKVYVAKGDYWVRAPHSGSCRFLKKIGDEAARGEAIAIISDLFGSHAVNVTTESDGIIVGLRTLPLVNRGDAMAHIATFTDRKKVKRAIALDTTDSTED